MEPQPNAATTAPTRHTLVKTRRLIGVSSFVSCREAMPRYSAVQDRSPFTAPAVRAIENRSARHFLDSGGQLGPAGSDRPAFRKSSFSPLGLAAEAWREPIALAVDVAGEGRAEMTRHQARAAAGAMLERRPSAFARVLLVETGEAVPVRLKDLH